MAIDQHLLSFFDRFVHVASMAVMFGGSAVLFLLARSSLRKNSTELIKSAVKFEGWFWAALGIQVITGIGNLGAFGESLPATNTTWGVEMTIKFGAVLILLLASVVRTLVIALLAGSDLDLHGSMERVLQVAYGGTASFLLGVLFLAVALAHG